MSRYISKERLRSAVASLAEWRTSTQSQLSTHLFPLLSLIRGGVNSAAFVKYEESDDFEFFDAFFWVPGDDDNPYFDPLVRQRRIATHPHSNVATARKGTFENSWGAAESVIEGGNTYWKLSENFADIVRRKVMTRRGDTTRANMIDLAVWLFKNVEFSDNADARSLERLFRNTFQLTDDQYDKLFEFNDESEQNIFAGEPLKLEDIVDVVDALEITKEKATARYLNVPAQHSDSELDDDDPILQEVRAVLEMGSSGIILRGCPGTGKSWYAWNIALDLANGELENITRVQFHSSYGYEDFVEGYRPTETKKSGFEIVDRKFLNAIRRAGDTRKTVVFIIDEINRGDPSRIFGELLTYIEEGWRDVEFTLSFSEKHVSIPRNLVVLATMNQHDRSITQLDMAMVRRFDHIDILPSKDRVNAFLERAGLPPHQIELVVDWFEALQGILPFGIGHTYFLNVGDVSRLAIVWRYRILPFCESVLEFEQERLEEAKRSFDALRRRLLAHTMPPEG